MRADANMLCKKISIWAGNVHWLAQTFFFGYWNPNHDILSFSFCRRIIKAINICFKILFVNWGNPLVRVRMLSIKSFKIICCQKALLLLVLMLAICFLFLLCLPAYFSSLANLLEESVYSIKSPFKSNDEINSKIERKNGDFISKYFI